MEISIVDKKMYFGVMLRLSIITVVSAFLCTVFGYLFLPFASAFYALILSYEKGPHRILSYAIPVVMFTVNFTILGIFSLEGIAYVLVGLLIYLLAKRGVSKGECAFWVSLLTVALMLLSSVLLAFDMTGSVSTIAIHQFYSNLYLNFKTNFVELLTSITTSNGDMLSFVYNIYTAEALFNELVMSLIPLVMVFAFAITGLALKFFTRGARKHSSADSLIHVWEFKTSSLVAYFYIIVAFISLIIENDASIFAYVIITLNTVFSVVYSYISVKFIFAFMLSRGKSSFFVIVIMCIVAFLLSSYILTILSFIGVYINLTVNKIMRMKKDL